VLLELAQYFNQRVRIELCVNGFSALSSLDRQSADRLVHQVKLINEWVEHFDHRVLHLKNQSFVAPGFPLKFLFNSHKLEGLLLLIEVHAREYILLSICERTETDDSIDGFDSGG
jgi:hypothetical protein